MEDQAQPQPPPEQAFVKFWSDNPLPEGYSFGGNGIVIPVELGEQMVESWVAISSAQKVIDVAHRSAQSLLMESIQKQQRAFETALGALGVNLIQAQGIEYDRTTRSLYKRPPPPPQPMQTGGPQMTQGPAMEPTPELLEALRRRAEARGLFPPQAQPGPPPAPVPAVPMIDGKTIEEWAAEAKGKAPEQIEDATNRDKQMGLGALR